MRNPRFARRHQYRHRRDIGETLHLLGDFTLPNIKRPRFSAKGQEVSDASRLCALQRRSYVGRWWYYDGTKYVVGGMVVP